MNEPLFTHVSGTETERRTFVPTPPQSAPKMLRGGAIARLGTLVRSRPALLSSAARARGTLAPK